MPHRKCSLHPGRSSEGSAVPARGKWASALGDVHYLTYAETAKLVRTALRESFPGVKFSVRAKTYSGGASISVWWTDGPMRADVEAVARQFEGADFDGMIDLKSSRQHWLTSDGRVRLAYREGTTGSRGVIEPMVDEPIPGAQRVHFGADFIFCTRILSNELRQTIQDKIAVASFPMRPRFEDLEREAGAEIYPTKRGTIDEYGLITSRVQNSVQRMLPNASLLAAFGKRIKTLNFPQLPYFPSHGTKQRVQRPRTSRSKP